VIDKATSPFQHFSIFKSFRVIVQRASMMVAFVIASGPTHESISSDP
jgi:hypothetical protein